MYTYGCIYKCMYIYIYICLYIYVFIPLYIQNSFEVKGSTKKRPVLFFDLESIAILILMQLCVDMYTNNDLD